MPVTAEDLMAWAGGHKSETMAEDEPLPGEVEDDQDPDAPLEDGLLAPRNVLWAGEWDGDPNSITPEMAEELIEFLAENEPAIAAAVLDLGSALVGDEHVPEAEAPGEVPPAEDEPLDDALSEDDEDDEPLFGDDEEDEEELEAGEEDEPLAEELEEGDEEELEAADDEDDDDEPLFGDDVDEEGDEDPFGEEAPAGEDEPFGEETPGEAVERAGDPNSSPVESAKNGMMEAVQNLNPEYPELTPAQRARASDFIAEEMRAFGHPAKDSPEWKRAVAIGLAKARKE